MDDLAGFDAWLASQGKSLTTRAVYVSTVRRGLAALGDYGISTAALDDYATRLGVGPRNTFRTAWRQYVLYASQGGSLVAPGSGGRLSKPAASTPRPARREDVAIWHLSRAIPTTVLAQLRWSNVTFTSPADAQIRIGTWALRAHRRVLEVLRAWGNPSGRPEGAVIPDAPDGIRFMPPDEIEARVLAGSVGGAWSHDPTARFLASLPPPRRETLDGSDRNG